MATNKLLLSVSGPPNHKEGKLLGVQQLERESGKAQAEATYDLLEVWNLEEKIQASGGSRKFWWGGIIKFMSTNCV